MVLKMKAFDYKEIPIDHYRDSIIALRESLKEEINNGEELRGLINTILNANHLVDVTNYSENLILNDDCDGCARLLFAVVHPTIIKNEGGGLRFFCDFCEISQSHLYYNSVDDISAALSDVISSELSEWVNQS